VFTGFHTILITDPRDLDGMIADLKRHPFTLLTGINSLFVSLMNHPDFDSVDFSRLKWVNSGGAPLNTEIARRWQERTGSVVREGYGLTETSPVVVASTSKTPYKEGFIGQPVIDTWVKTVDDDGKETPRGEPGEVLIKGPQVMQGYWHRPDETAATFTEDGWLKTGDVGLLDEEGFLKLVDRKKDMILVSGFNVYPNDVEDAVMRHASIRECVAVGVPDERTGEAIKIFVSLNDATLDEAAIIAHCRENLTGYKIPKHVEIRDDLPKSTVGKLLRRVLRDEARGEAKA
jgi:long-chain acyl-CoA synthetase